MPRYVKIESLQEKPHSAILGYPRAGRRQLLSRVVEAKRLGITDVCFFGPSRICGLDVLGKGYSGIVLLARIGRRRVALKIRRTDSPRRTMKEEAVLLGAANAAGAGPALISAGRNMIAMEYLNGIGIGRWIGSLGGRAGAKRARSVLVQVLEEAYRLDRAGIDHGELSRISRHVMISSSSGKAVIIDFESASTGRRVANVTSATQAIFIGSGIARDLQNVLGISTRERIIESLRIYKRDPGRKSFDGLLRVLGL